MPATCCMRATSLRITAAKSSLLLFVGKSSRPAKLSTRPGSSSTFAMASCSVFTVPRGVPAGATMPNHDGMRVGQDTAGGVILPERMCGSDDASWSAWCEANGLAAMHAEAAKAGESVRPQGPASVPGVSRNVVPR